MSAQCTGIVGRLFGHKWVEYGKLLSRTQLCVYLHYAHPQVKNKTIPITGKFCVRCGVVTEESK